MNAQTAIINRRVKSILWDKRGSKKQQKETEKREKNGKKQKD